MSLIRFGRGRDYEFFRREDIKSRWDLDSATRFLKGFRSDSRAMAGFRRQVLSSAAAGAKNLTDDQVIAAYARLLVSGDVVVAMPARDARIGHLSVEAPAEAPVAPAPAKPARQEEEEEQPTFGNDHDGVAQAEALIAAARAAYPFCEECQRLAVQRMQGANA